MPLNCPSKWEKSSRPSWKSIAGCGVKIRKENGGGYVWQMLSVSTRRDRRGCVRRDASGKRVQEAKKELPGNESCCRVYFTSVCCTHPFKLLKPFLKVEVAVHIAVSKSTSQNSLYE